jgi:hypothetical protein
MTMHLVGPYLTTTSYKKRQIKMTKAKQAEFEQRWRDYNKWAKRNNLPKMTMEEYIDYCCGKVRVTKKVQPTKATLNTVDEVLHRSIDHRKQYPSLNSVDVCGVAAKRASPVYTGTLIKGIATMHKSNAVPVFNSEQAQDIAKMRR